MSFWHWASKGRDHDAARSSEVSGFRDVYLWTRIAVPKDATICEMRVSEPGPRRY